MNKNILILNLLNDDSYKTSFNNRIKEVFQDLPVNFDIIYLEEMKAFAGFERYTHLLISGSRESVTEELPWYQDLDVIINRFMTDGKSILGICFGHQFLVRNILGKDHVRKSVTPEFGWTDIKHNDVPLFNGIGKFKSGVFHYDEVCNIRDQFDIIASSEKCNVQGFQVKGMPVWGVQFHPDFMYQDVYAFTEEVRLKESNFDEMHCDTEITAEEFSENDKVFKNWIEIS